MSYSNRLSYYRRCIEECLRSEDAHGVKMNLIAYSGVLRAMARDCGSYSDRAYLGSMAERFDLIAAYLTHEGLSQRVREAIRNQGRDLPPPRAAAGASARAANPTPPSTQAAQPSQAPQPTPPSTVNAVGNGDTEWVADMFARYVGATVEVHTELSAGTGFFIHENGYLLTNHHVVHTGNRRENDLRIVSCNAALCGAVELIAADREKDLALLHFGKASGKVPFIPLLRDFGEVRAGIDVMLIGNGLSFGLAPISGTVKFPHKSDDGSLVYTAMTNGGDSGSPLINRHGECVAIHRARESEQGRASARGIAYATAVDDILELLTVWKRRFGLPI